MKPRFIAAIQYAILALFFWASWWLLLSPLDRAIGQLQFIFAPDYENRTFFVFYALAAAVSPGLAVAFSFNLSNSKPFAIWLAIVATIFLAIAVWLFDTSLIFGFGLGSACAIWHIFSLTPHSSGTPNGAP